MSKISESDLASIQELSDHLGRSSKMVVPVFALGILATIVGAGIAIYYIFNLSERLEQTQLDLKRTEAVLEDTKRGLATTQIALKDLEQASSQEDPTISAAISEVSKSQDDLSLASTALDRASKRLPAQTTKSVAQQQSEGGLSGLWVDGYGTNYRITQEGNRISYSTQFAQRSGAGNVVGNARGTIDGRTARYRFNDSTGRVLNCTATVSINYKSMEEKCIDPREKNATAQVVTLIRT